MHTLALSFVLIAGAAQGSPECANPPSAAYGFYWDYIEACGCAKLDAPSRASLIHDRFVKACSDWRQRNPR